MKPSSRSTPISDDQRPLVPAVSKRSNQSNIEPTTRNGARNIDPRSRGNGDVAGVTRNASGTTRAKV